MEEREAWEKKLIAVIKKLSKKGELIWIESIAKEMDRDGDMFFHSVERYFNEFFKLNYLTLRGTLDGHKVYGVNYLENGHSIFTDYKHGKKLE